MNMPTLPQGSGVLGFFSPSRTGLLKVVCLCVLLFSIGCAKQPRSASPLPDAEVVVLKTRNAKSQTDLISVARTAIGTPYRFGGTSPQKGFDCSGLIMWSYQQIGVDVPRTARDQFQFGAKVDKSELQPGDLVFFKGTNRRTGWHTGIYTGNGMFLHSPRTGKSVEEASLDSTYFSKYYVGARRVPRDGSEKALYAAYQEEMRQNANANLTAKRSAAEKKRLAVKKGKKASTLAANTKKTGVTKKKSVAAKQQAAKKAKIDNKTKTAAVSKKPKSRASGRNS